MNARQYLGQLEALDSKIYADVELLKEKKIRITGGGAIRYDKDRVQTSLTDSKLERDVCEVVAFEEKVNERIKQYDQAKEKIIKQIKDLNVATYIDILFRVYVQYMSIKQCASDMGRSYSFIKDQHTEALKAFEQKYQPLKYLT